MKHLIIFSLCLKPICPEHPMTSPRIDLIHQAVRSADGSNQWHHQNNLWANWHHPKNLLAQSKNHNKVRLEKGGFLICHQFFLYSVFSPQNQEAQMCKERRNTPLICQQKSCCCGRLDEDQQGVNDREEPGGNSCR